MSEAKSNGTRIYVVISKDTAIPHRLVRATNPAQVARFLVRETWPTIEVAEQDDLVLLAGGGVKVENATTADPA